VRKIQPSQGDEGVENAARCSAIKLESRKRYCRRARSRKTTCDSPVITLRLSESCSRFVQPENWCSSSRSSRFCCRER